MSTKRWKLDVGKQTEMSVDEVRKALDDALLVYVHAPIWVPSDRYNIGEGAYFETTKSAIRAYLDDIEVEGEQKVFAVYHESNGFFSIGAAY